MALDGEMFDVISKVYTVQQPFQRLLSDAVDGAVAFARLAKLESRERERDWCQTSHLCIHVCDLHKRYSTRFVAIVAACIMI